METVVAVGLSALRRKSPTRLEGMETPIIGTAAPAAMTVSDPP